MFSCQLFIRSWFLFHFIFCHIASVTASESANNKHCRLITPTPPPLTLPLPSSPSPHTCTGCYVCSWTKAMAWIPCPGTAVTFTLSSTHTLQITGSLGHTESAGMLAVTNACGTFWMASSCSSKRKLCWCDWQLWVFRMSSNSYSRLAVLHGGLTFWEKPLSWW